MTQKPVIGRCPLPGTDVVPSVVAPGTGAWVSESRWAGRYAPSRLASARARASRRSVLIDVVDDQREPALDEVQRHAPSDVPESDESHGSRHRLLRIQPCHGTF